MRLRLLLGVGLIAAVLGTTAAPVSAQSSGEKKFCKGVADISLFFNKLDGPPSSKDAKRIGKLLQPIEKNAPSALAAPVATAIAGVQAGSFEDPAVDDAVSTVDAWVTQNCGYQVVKVTGNEYAFQGIPDSLKPGITIFEFTNTGAELHEVSIVRIKGKESVHELLDLPEKELEKKVSFLGTGFAEQAVTDHAYVNLKPGRYAAVCFLPVGSTDEASAESSQGAPHAAEGMVAEFTVKKAN
jgi:plastocyanin